MTDQASVGIKRINPPELGATPGYSQVVEIRGACIIFIAGQTALDRNGEVVGKGNFAQQAAQVFENLTVALRSVGCTAANLIKLTVFVRSMDDLSAYREARDRFFATVTSAAAPAVTLVEVSRLCGPDFLIEVEAIAVPNCGKSACDKFHRRKKCSRGARWRRASCSAARRRRSRPCAERNDRCRQRWRRWRFSLARGQIPAQPERGTKDA